MMRIWSFVILLGGTLLPAGNTQPIPTNNPVHGRLSLSPSNHASQTIDFQIPLPAHAQPHHLIQETPFKVESSRETITRPAAKEAGSAEYFLMEEKPKDAITPETANVNLPADTVLRTCDTGERILLPAGTYRQIAQFPMDSPLMEKETQTRGLNFNPTETDQPRSRYAPPPKKRVWVRYESLEKIHIGEAERRGGLDLPSEATEGEGPRVWYAKAETADWASSVFYFVFGGFGYGVANLAGWSAGNVRQIPNDFEYRLIRK